MSGLAFFLTAFLAHVLLALSGIIIPLLSPPNLVHAGSVAMLTPKGIGGPELSLERGSLLWTGRRRGEMRGCPVL